MSGVVRLRAGRSLPNWLCWLSLVVVMAGAAGAWAGPSPVESASRTIAPGARVGVVRLDDQINDVSVASVKRRMEAARAAGSQWVILEIRTLGGAVISAQDLSTYLKSRDYPVVALVDGRAYSAGAMISMACGQIWMKPGSVIGDCAPILVREDGGVEQMQPTERAKQESPVLADFSDSAMRNGHDIRLARAMVQLGNELYAVSRPGESAVEVVSANELAAWRERGFALTEGVPSPLNGAGTLLTVYDGVAGRIGLSRGTVAGAEELAARLSPGATVAGRWDTSWAERIVTLLSSTAVRSILLVVFLQSLYMAISAPGKGAAEAVCVTSFAILAVVPLLTGYATWLEILAILVGVALIAFEIFVFPGHLVALVLGLILLLGGLVLTFVPKEPGGGIGSMPATWTALMTGIWSVLGAMAAVIAISALLAKYMQVLPLGRDLVLTGTAVSSPERMSMLDDVPAIGTRCVAATDLRPGGTVEVQGAKGPQRFSASAGGQYVLRGAAVEVTGIEGNTLTVREVTA